MISQLHSLMATVIIDHGGTVTQYLGDGLLALFGLHQTSESDPENAIRAALEIQHSELRITDYELRLRVGIHTGLIVTGEIGTDLHREFTATGDAMNLAARLQAAAPPAGVLISHDTYRYVRGVFDVTLQPALTVKGKREAVQTYLVRRSKPRPFRTVTRGVAGLQTHTVGREKELAQLRNAYLNAFENRCKVWAQLIGEPGIGKSRVLEEMRDWIELRSETVRVLRGRAFAGDQNHPYALIRRIWFDRFQIAEDTPLSQAEARWLTAFRELSGIEEQEPAQALGLLVGLSFKDSPYIGAMRNNPKQVRGRAFVVSRQLIRRLRIELPVELLLEDLHWTDASSWEYLQQVILDSGVGREQEREVGAPSSAELNGMFILATARPEWNPPEALREPSISSKPSAEENPTFRAQRLYHLDIPITPLTDEATHELVRELLEPVEGMPETVHALVVHRAEGVPYYAEELVNWFIDRGIIDTRAHPWRFVAQRFEESPLPATLQHLLLTRLSALAEAERTALQRGSVFGRNFWARGIEALGVHQSIRVLNQIALRGLVALQPESAFSGESEWSFNHNLLRDVTYESVLKRDRATLHRAAAHWLEEQARVARRLDEFAGLLGEHYERAGDSSVAVGWYLRAGDQAQTSNALEARKFYDRALELAPADDRETQWQALIGREAVFDLRGERDAQQADLNTLLELAHTFD
ncbi:MAG: adenylate/guanylate cyclase domain-containing protein, partial [Anaerolineae bacterium]